MCLVTRQAMTAAYLKAAVLASCRVAGPTAVETHRNFVKRRCFMTERGLMNILHGKRSYLYIQNLTAKPVSLPKCMTIVTVSIAL